MRRRLLVLGVIAFAVVAAGSAVAATKLSSPSARSKAIIDDAAGRLHVAPDALSSALKQAYDDQIDAEVKSGQISKQQGDRLKAQVAKGQAPLVGGFGYGFGRGGFGFGGKGFGLGRPGMFGFAGGLFGTGLETVTSYLGITQSQLMTAMGSGKSLAQIATAHGKTAAGLVAALVAAEKSQLDKAVAAKHLTAAQEKAIIAKMPSLLQKLVDGKAPVLGRGFHFGFGGQPHGFGRGGGPFGGGFAGGMFGMDSKTVSSYLGITAAQLRTAERSGKSLAQIAKAHGKTAAGLVAALVAAEKSRLDKAVAAKHLTAAQEKAILSKASAFLKILVNGTPRSWFHMRQRGAGPGSFGQFSWPSPGRGSSTQPSAFQAPQL